MWKIPKTTAYSILLLSLLAIVGARGHPVGLTGLVSDGVGGEDEGADQYSVLGWRGILGNISSEECEQMYGFLPCSNNMFGHLFLIVVYEYLMFHGESYLASGGEQIFKILGPGVFGASVFQVLGALPESLILLGKLDFSTPFAIIFFCFIFFFFLRIDRVDFLYHCSVRIVFSENL